MKRFAVAVLFAVLAAAPAFAAEIVVEIDETTTFQTMEGFGAAITESSAWLLYNVLTPAERTNLLNDLFSPEDGIGLSYVRHPMGASDFRLADYTYDDVPPGQTDFALANFSIAHDELCILPVLQHAASVNTNLKIIASPWSPPAWMKDSEDLYYGRLRNDAHDAFAKYFVRFVQSYASNGLPIEAVTLQNEPLFEPYSYAGMYMEATNQARLATRVGQDFASNGITTRILAYDHNWDQYQYPITVMNDAAANPYVAGSAFHGYAGDVAAQSLVHDAHPDKDIYITEITAGEWAAGFDDTLLWDAATLIVGGARHWARAVIKWNLALDQNNGPKTSGGCDTCYGIVTINTNTHAVTRNADYYSLAHASKFVRRGAVRVAATETPAVGPYSVAFVNPDASTVVIAANFHTTERHFVLRWKEQSAGYMLPPRSVATFTWPDVPGATADVWITTGDQTKLLEKQSAGPVFAPLSIEWKGRTWAVHDTLGDPGGNLWSAGCAWVDTNDCLRLEVKSVASNWYAGQVESTDPLSHGTYRWYVKGRPDLFDSNIVARLSTYFDAYHELDIDYTQAHDDAPTNLYYTVQPYYLNGHQQMFQHSLTSDYSTHEFAWNPRRVEYRSWYGHTSSPPAGALISEWSYEGDDVPNDTNEHVRMNLWMFDAMAPSVSQQLVLADFIYQCSTGAILFDEFEDASLGAMWSAYTDGGGQIAESGGDLRLTPANTNGHTLGTRTTDDFTWGDNGLSYVFAANLSTITVTAARSAGGPDVWAYQALVSGSNGVYNPYTAMNAATLRAGYDASADQLTIEFLTKTGSTNNWGNSRYVGTIDNASTLLADGGLQIRFTLVYYNYEVSASYAGSPVSMTTVSGSTTGAHTLGTALHTAHYVAGAQNHDEGRGTVCWEQVEGRADAVLESTAGGDGNGGTGAKEVQIGEADPATTWRAPIDTWYKSHRSQVLYHRDLIDRSGTITQLVIYVLNVPDTDLLNYTIRLQHTATNQIPGTYVNSGWTTVYQQTIRLPAGTNGWLAFPFSSPFRYNCASNLLADFMFTCSADRDPAAAVSYTASEYPACRVCTSDRDNPQTWTTYPSGRKFSYTGNRFIDVRLLFEDEPETEIGRNLSFEDGPLGFLTNVPSWEVEGSVFAGSVKASPVLHKSQSLKLWKNGGDGDQKLFQFFNIETTNEYTLNGYLLSQSVESFKGTNAYGALMLQWYGSAGLLRTDESAHFTETTMNNVWNYFEVSGVPPENTTSGRIVCALVSSPDQEGALFFDHLGLTAAPGPASTNITPVSKTVFLADEFNDTTRSNIWTLTGDWDGAEFQEANGSFRVKPGTSMYQSSGYVSASPVTWNNTSCWYVFSATLATIRVDQVVGGEDLAALLGLCSENNNPWYVTNSVGLYGYYSEDTDQLTWRLLTKTDKPAGEGDNRFEAIVTDASRYLNSTNRIRITIALGLSQYEVRFSDNAGLPIPHQVSSGAARGPHWLGDKLCSGHWMVGVQSGNTNRGSVYWDRTEVYDTCAPAAGAACAAQTSTDGSGLVTVTGRVSDANGLPCRLQIEASTNGGVAWFNPWISGLSSTLGASIASTQGQLQVVQITTTNSGGYVATNTLTLTWDTLSANNGMSLAGKTCTNVLLRVVPDDGDVSGNSTTGQAFVVDDEGPAHGAATALLEDGAAYTLATNLVCSWSGFTDAGAGISGYYCSFSDGGGTTSGSWWAGSPGMLYDAALDATNHAFVWARDAFGNIGAAVSDSILVLSPGGDWDDDDMPNSWEDASSLDPLDAADADEDPDEDGYDNRDEFFCDTNPGSSSSALNFHGEHMNPTEEFLLEWDSSADRLYNIYSRTSLILDWEPVDGWTNVTGVGGTMVYTGSTAGVEFRTYRLEVVKP